MNRGEKNKKRKIEETSKGDADDLKRKKYENTEIRRKEEEENT